MAKWKFEFEGIKEYNEQLEKFALSGSIAIIKKAVYEGAGVAVKEVEAAIRALPEQSVDKGRYMSPGTKLTKISPAQKRGLLNGLGLAKMRNDKGFVNTRIGFTGYNSVKTKKYPNGQPNALIVRSIVKGGGRRKKLLNIVEVCKKSQDAISAAMQAQLDKDIKETFGE